GYFQHVIEFGLAHDLTSFLRAGLAGALAKKRRRSGGSCGDKSPHRHGTIGNWRFLSGSLPRSNFHDRKGQIVGATTAHRPLGPANDQLEIGSKPMRKFALSVALLAAASLSTAALAADSTASGTIKALDAKACTVTLDTSTVYHFDAKCDLSKFKVGEKVAITWAAKNNAD